MILNRAACVAIQAHADGADFLVEAPIRGRRLSCVTVDAAAFPAAHAFLNAALIEQNRDAQPSAQGAVELAEIGLLVAADDMSREVEYHIADCHPDYDGPLLVQGGNGPDGPVDLEQLEIPPVWRDRAIAFAIDADCGLWAPRRLHADADHSRQLNDHDDGVAWARNPSLDDAHTVARFQSEGFVELQRLLPAADVAELGRYYEALASEGYLPCLEDSGSHRYVAHSHPVAQFWHQQLTHRVGRLAGKTVKPSYCFVSVYAAGGELRWHTDRPPCEYTVAILLGCAPLAPGQPSPWALQLEDRHGVVHAIHQRVGEGLAFRGRQLRHSRDVLPPGLRSTSLMLHYVDEDYCGEMV